MQGYAAFCIVDGLLLARTWGLVWWLVAVVSGLLHLDYWLEISCEQRAVKGLPTIQGYPIVGSLFSLGPSQALTYRKWAQELESPVFQMRLGCKRVIVANDFESVKTLWIDNMAANVSRPIFYTFHKVVSKTQGFTIGTTPWSETFRRKKRVADRNLSKPSVRMYLPIIDRESRYCIEAIIHSEGYGDGSGKNDMDIRHYFNTYALNTSLTLNYGTRLNELDKDMIQDILDVEKQISRFRASLHNYQDYIPFLRLFPFGASRTAIECRQRRDRYMDILLNKLRLDLSNGSAMACIAGSILTDSNAMSSAHAISAEELKSICLTMVSAGLDTVPSMLIYFMGHMSNPDYGQRIQNRILDEIAQAYPHETLATVWDRCLTEEKGLAYVRAVVKETLRFSAMPISLPRETIRDIRYTIGNRTVTIPANSILIMNSFAANFDVSIYGDAYKFRPERFLGPDQPKPSHFAFGAGKRMCSGINLAERELFIAIVRMVTTFAILPPLDPTFQMPSDPFELYKVQKSMIVEPPPFRVRLKSRSV